jgi:hypothetical protein
MDAEIPELGDKGTYNCRPSRTSSNLSRHAGGTAWDPATEKVVNGRVVPDLVLNDRVARFFVIAAPDLGVQRVIANGLRADGTKGPREWDSRPGEREFERYSGPLHDDHVHVELCNKAARELTRAQVRIALKRYWYGALLEEAEGVFFILSKSDTVVQGTPPGFYVVSGVVGKGARSVVAGTGKAGTAKKRALEAVGHKIYTKKDAVALAKAFTVV